MSQIALKMFYIDNSATVRSPSLSTIYRLGTNKKALSGMDNAHLVELMQNNWHQIEPELGRWRNILAIPWNRYKQLHMPGVT
jgi:hypothetical protein